MTCPRSIDGIHRADNGGEVCTQCGRTRPGNLVESRVQPWRAEIRPVPGARAFGVVDFAKRRAGDE